MSRISTSVINIFLAALLSWGLLAVLVAHADEAPSKPILLETGGALQAYHSSTGSLEIGGHSYRIDPLKTRVVLQAPEGQRVLSTRELNDLPELIRKFHGRPVFFQADPQGMLEVLVLIDAFESTSEH